MTKNYQKIYQKICHFTPVFLLFFNVFLFASITYISSFMLPELLLSKGISKEQLDNIESVEMLGYIISGLLLTPLINKIDNNKITVISLIISIVGLLNLIMLNDYLMVKLNFILISAAYYSYITVTIIKIIESSANHKYFSLIIFSLVWIAGYFFFYYLPDFFESSMNGLLSCILLYSLMIFTCLNKEEISKITKSVSRFSFLIENIELQVLTGFMVSYITFEILWYYNAFALLKNLPVLDINLIIHNMLICILFLITPIILIFKTTNKYLANLILIIILLTSFILLPIYGKNLIGNITLLCITGVCLCSIFICNILILSDKFETQDFRTAFTIYTTMSAIGMYSGALSSHISYGPDKNAKDFLLSAFVVVGTFAIYYLWYFFRRKLYR
jgi:hypothetical protein